MGSLLFQKLTSQTQLTPTNYPTAWYSELCPNQLLNESISSTTSSSTFAGGVNFIKFIFI
jgi:hypothetical protein